MGGGTMDLFRSEEMQLMQVRSATLFSVKFSLRPHRSPYSRHVAAADDAGGVSSRYHSCSWRAWPAAVQGLELREVGLPACIREPGAAAGLQ